MPPEALQTLVPAVAVSLGASLVLLRRRGETTVTGGPGRLAAGAAVSCGYLAGHVGLQGWPGVPPSQADGWIAWLALGALAAGLLETAWGGRRGPAIVIRAFTSALAAAAIASALVPTQPWGRWAPGVLLGASIFCLWIVEESAARRAGPGLALAWMVAAAAASITLVHSYSARLALLAAALAAACGALGGITLLRPQAIPGAAGPFTVIFLGILANGHFFAELTSENLRLLTGSALAPALLLLALPARVPAWLRALFAVLAAAVLSGLAIAGTLPAGGEQ